MLYSTADQGTTDRDGLKPRPAWLRALGRDEPPPRIEALGRSWRRQRLYKHDAFAATALYADAQGERLVVKFSRRSPAWGVPLGWLGRHLRRKEQRFYRRLADVASVPDDAGDITVGGAVHPTAAAHHYVAGRPLREDDRPDDAFFPDLAQLLDEVHARGVAVVDFNKPENIIVDEHGRPHLIDFQLSAMLGERFPFNGRLARRWIAALQRADRYHLTKHWLRQRPDQLADDPPDLDALRPLGAKLVRRLWRPVILMRRRLFVWLGVRRGRGTADTEAAVDVSALRMPALRHARRHADTPGSDALHRPPQDPAGVPAPALLSAPGEAI